MRRRNPENVLDLAMVGVVAAGAYFIYQLLNKQLPKVTAPVSTVIANAWNKLTLGAPLKVLGDVVLPDGTDIGPLSTYQVGTDSAGNVYIQAMGAMYQIGQSDSNGNWPVQLALAPNFGVTGTTW